ncbi:TetR/AcrR family transcriptional regulator [Amycolatopsis suaedae]|uniref:TetR family transcriptional regulator n=1 Tax=Amycolatopsis suaedae TaxID=2510978 RepID=A0A4Q7J4I5_9PSEU|nr:TetR family transcriptional regulator [Amycolatopsis suaedae]RZQ61917.1 TetR family transcriptional regulator [Amycolatopsis suaedae]
MGTRRTDPDRRDRIIDTALDVIAEDGVAGTSHRKVAARADVPLGSMTYHFTSMDELLLEAFTRFATGKSRRFDDRMRRATSWDEACEAVTDIIHLDAITSQRDLVLVHELYTLAARLPAYREITRDWMTRSRASLGRAFDPDTCRQVDALIEGLTIHRALDSKPQSRALTLAAVRRLAGPPAD